MFRTQQTAEDLRDDRRAAVAVANGGDPRPKAAGCLGVRRDPKLTDWLFEQERQRYGSQAAVSW